MAIENSIPADFLTVLLEALWRPDRMRATRSNTPRPQMRGHASLGLDPSLFGTRSLRRTKATLIYRRTGNPRAV
jgi:hypothetical protein